MNFISDIIIVTLLSAFLLTVVAVISYKLGKKEKSKMIIHRRDRFSEKEINNKTKQAETPEKKEEMKKETPITPDHKSRENKVIQENMIPLKEFYSKKIENEINNAEKSNIYEDEKLSEFKFLKYTSKGYKPAKGDNESRIVRWR